MPQSRFSVTTAGRVLAGCVVVALVASASCGSNDARAGGAITPVYDRTTGRLQEIDGRGVGGSKGETRAFVDGAEVRRIEIDRDGDGRPDRWEYYAQVPGEAGHPSHSVLVRAEESSRPDGHITRREFYVNGVIEHVEEDTDGDGRIDTWDYFEHGALVRVDLDLTGAGRPTRRLVYRPGGGLDHIEVDTDGSGTFHPVAADSGRGASDGGAGSEVAHGRGRTP